MSKRRINSRLFLVASSLAVALLFVFVPSLVPAPADARVLDGVTGPVNEVTAPIQEAVDESVPPVTPPPPVSEPPPVKLPEAQVPEVPMTPAPVKPPEAPVKVPAPQPIKVPVSPTTGNPPDAPKVVESAKSTVETVTKTVTQAGETATSAGDEAAGNAKGAAAERTTSVQKTAGSAARVLSAPQTGSGAGSRSAQETAAGAAPSARGSKAENGTAALATGAKAAPASADSPGVLAGVPARFLSPFVYVWPAVALLAEGPLGDFVGDWSRSLLTLLEDASPGSLGGEGSALDDATATEASSSSSQPPWSWFASHFIPPFNWIGGGAALPVFVFLLILAAGTASILLAMRRQLGARWLPGRRH